MACPHTMKATDPLGITYCCDCGKMLKPRTKPAKDKKYLCRLAVSRGLVEGEDDG